MGIVLLYGMDIFRENAVAQVAEKMKIRVRRVSPDEADIPIRRLLETETPVVITGRDEMIPEVLFMALESAQIMEVFIKELRRASVQVALKAMATPTNINWTIRQLASELVREHQQMTGKGA